MLSLNAFPISFEKNSKIAICKIPYDEQLLRDLRVKHQDTYAFYRMGDKIVCVSADDVYPVAGEQAELDADNNYGSHGSEKPKKGYPRKIVISFLQTAVELHYQKYHILLPIGE